MEFLVNIDDITINFSSIYGPSSNDKLFLNKLSKHMETVNEFLRITGGDWNHGRLG